MSVRVKLTNKNFFGESFVIGARLYEGEAQQTQNASTDQQATSQDNSQNASTGQAQQQQQQGQQQPAQQQQQPMDQVVNGIVAKAFSNLPNMIGGELSKIQGPKWVTYQQPNEQTVAAIFEAVKTYINANIQAATQFIQSQQGQQGQQQQPANNEQ